MAFLCGHILTIVAFLKSIPGVQVLKLFIESNKRQVYMIEVNKATRSAVSKSNSI